MTGFPECAQALSRGEIAFPGLQLLLILVMDCCQGKQEITLQKRKYSQLKSSPLSCHPDAGKWSSEVGSKNAIRALRHKSFLEISRGGERGGNELRKRAFRAEFEASGSG